MTTIIGTLSPKAHEPSCFHARACCWTPFQSRSTALYFCSDPDRRDLRDRTRLRGTRSRLGPFAMRQSGTAVKRLCDLKIFTRLIPKLQIIRISKGKPAPCNHGCLMTELAEYNNVCLNVSQQVSGSNRRADRIFPLIWSSL